MPGGPHRRQPGVLVALGAADRLEDDPEVWVRVLRANTAFQDRPLSPGADLKVVQGRGDATTLDAERGGLAATDPPPCSVAADAAG